MTATERGPFRWNRRVEFCETDAAGIAHFSSFLLYMEQAEHALFREIGSSIMPADFHRSGESEPACTWPRVRCECEFLAPARFEDVIEIRLAVERLGTKSVSYLHEMRIDERLIARGRIVAVCSIHAQGKLKGFPIPPAIHQALSAYLLTQPDPSA